MKQLLVWLKGFPIMYLLHIRLSLKHKTTPFAILGSILHLFWYKASGNGWHIKKFGRIILTVSYNLNMLASYSQQGQSTEDNYNLQPLLLWLIFIFYLKAQFSAFLTSWARCLNMYFENVTAGSFIGWMPYSMPYQQCQTFYTKRQSVAYLVYTNIQHLLWTWTMWLALNHYE